MVKKILLGLAALIVLFLIVVAVQSNRFTVTRSAKIDAPPAEVFAHVNDFHKWTQWSPWEKVDPNLQRTYSGNEAGEGAKYAWVGNSDVGEGHMTITESKPGELVKINLVFVKPFAGVCDTVFTFKPEGDGTQMTWTMSGDKNFMAKAIHLLMDMDKMCGDQFEQGMVNLNTVLTEKPAEAAALAEEPAATDAAAPAVDSTETTPTPTETPAPPTTP